MCCHVLSIVFVRIFSGQGKNARLLLSYAFFAWLGMQGMHGTQYIIVSCVRGMRYAFFAWLVMRRVHG